MRPPNADAERDFMQRLEEMNAQSRTEVYKARANSSIKPDARTKTLAEIGSHNGYVEAKGRDAMNQPVTESTKNHPLNERATLDPRQSFTDSLWYKAREIARSITS